MNNKWDIHFLSSYVCFKNFLNTINVHNNNLIFCNDNQFELLKLVREIFEQRNNIKIIEIKNLNVFNISKFKFKRYVESMKVNYLNTINIRQVYFYCDKFTSTQFYLIDSIKSYEKITFIDSEPKEILDRANGIKDIIKRLYLVYFNLGSEVKLRYINRGVKTVKWQHNFISKSCEKNESIVNNLRELGYVNYKVKNNKSKSLLYIHQNMNKIPNVDYIDTIKNLKKILTNYKLNGYEIFFKDHPNNKEDFSGLYDIVDKQNFIASYIPCEILESDFDCYLTYYSLGIKPFIGNECYSLYNYITFNKEDSTIKKFIETELNGIFILE